MYSKYLTLLQYHQIYSRCSNFSDWLHKVLRAFIFLILNPRSNQGYYILLCYYVSTISFHLEHFSRYLPPILSTPLFYGLLSHWHFFKRPGHLFRKLFYNLDFADHFPMIQFRLNTFWKDFGNIMWVMLYHLHYITLGDM